MATVEERVRAGATFMDANCVDWAGKIEAGKLDIQNCEKCVFGQAFDDHYINVCHGLGLTSKQAGDLGFCSDVSQEELSAAYESREAFEAHQERLAAEYRLLRSAWLAEIAIRLDADKPPLLHNPWATVLPAAPQPTRGVRDIVGSPA